MLNKQQVPSFNQIQEFIGNDSFFRLSKLEKFLMTHYQLVKEVKFPFGNNYGWGYKYSHKSIHLCHVFFEANAFTVTIQIGDKQVPLLEDLMQTFLPKTKELWHNRYPCGENGGWIHYRVLSDAELEDIYKLIEVKKKFVL